jgi:hypothetical protein
MLKGIRILIKCRERWQKQTMISQIKWNKMNMRSLISTTCGKNC